MDKGAKVLIIDDEPQIRKLLRVSLGAHGYDIDEAKTGQEGIYQTASFKPELVILDLGLPDMDGKEVVRRIREWSEVPIIILSARDQEQEKVDALDAGADDYVVKPVDLEELSARIRSQLRRRDRLQDNSISIGAVTLDLSGNTASLAGEMVALTSKEYRVLALLMRRNRRFVSKTDLEGELYDQEQWIESNTVEVAISSLRRKLGRDFIRTARGLGYMVGGQGA